MIYIADITIFIITLIFTLFVGITLGYYVFRKPLHNTIKLQDKIIQDYITQEKRLLEAIRTAEYNHNITIYK